MRLAICAVGGIAIGTGAAVWSVRAGALGARSAQGPWATGRDFGTAEASNYTRAVVALGGLLALPAREARYYTAATDDTGRPLDGRCHYRVRGGAMPAKWWSMTLYDATGYLVANAAGRYSVGSIGLSSDEVRHWTIAVGPDAAADRWLPTGGLPRFQLTLRLYLPHDGGTDDLSPAQWPRIERGDCA